MKQLEVSIVSVNELPAVAESILKFAEGRRVFAFEGEMGSGKTTLIKELCRKLGSQDSFSSPTYSVVNEYRVEATGEPVYHMDLYRLNKLQEALDIGVQEYLTGEHYCFIEWPELIEELLPAEIVRVCIKTEDNIRNVSIFMG